MKQTICDVCGLPMKDSGLSASTLKSELTFYPPTDSKDHPTVKMFAVPVSIRIELPTTHDVCSPCVEKAFQRIKL